MKSDCDPTVLSITRRLNWLSVQSETLKVGGMGFFQISAEFWNFSLETVLSRENSNWKMLIRLDRAITERYINPKLNPVGKTEN